MSKKRSCIDHRRFHGHRRGAREEFSQRMVAIVVLVARSEDKLRNLGEGARARPTALRHTSSPADLTDPSAPANIFASV